MLFRKHQTFFRKDKNVTGEKKNLSRPGVPFGMPLFKFFGGPLDRQKKEVHSEQLKGNQYRYYEWGTQSNPLAPLPPLFIHEYLAVGEEMWWVATTEFAQEHSPSYQED